MSKTIFISYCHKQGDWVTNRLAPCLRAGGAEVLIDIERFRAGRAVIGQMDGLQDQANVTVLILSPDYLRSEYCRHEMSRAIACDPQFAKGATLPVKREECEMPEEIASAEALWVNLQNDKDAAQWNLLLEACDANLGAEAPHWLDVRDELARTLERNESVNLIVTGQPKWREMIRHLTDVLPAPKLEEVDLDRGIASTRHGLVEAILKACGTTMQVPDAPKDLGLLDSAISARTLSRIALLHLDHVPHRPDYGIDLFAALRYLTTESRKLVLLAQSRQPITTLLPKDHPLSSFIPKVIELHGRNQ